MSEQVREDQSQSQRSRRRRPAGGPQPAQDCNQTDAELPEQCPGVRRLSSPAMMADLLGVPPAAIRHWIRTGLLDVVERSGSLEWLDFNRDLPYLSHRVCAFRTRRAGRFDGLHMHLVVQVHAYSSTRIPSFLLAHCVRLTF